MHPTKKAKARRIAEKARYVACATGGGLLVDEWNPQAKGVGDS